MSTANESFHEATTCQLNNVEKQNEQTSLTLNSPVNWIPDASCEQKEPTALHFPHPRNKTARCLFYRVRSILKILTVLSARQTPDGCASWSLRAHLKTSNLTSAGTSSSCLNCIFTHEWFTENTCLKGYVSSPHIKTCLIKRLDTRSLEHRKRTIKPIVLDLSVLLCLMLCSVVLNMLYSRTRPTIVSSLTKNATGSIRYKLK